MKLAVAALCMSVCLSGIDPGFYVAFLYFLQSKTATFVTITLASFYLSPSDVLAFGEAKGLLLYLLCGVAVLF